ncbi:hypothetical protein L6164_005006 [Bauhinia variegata]|uniref:Uncharacterized protein n=1 Tax=Bauhinia variegata TaxID=167791 RepID=A0ACB9PRB8_BAUVA|nr:hypothetical protein L6164_005006 [Bauhinia variegata]
MGLGWWPLFSLLPDRSLPRLLVQSKAKPYEHRRRQQPINVSALSFLLYQLKPRGKGGGVVYGVDSLNEHLS